MQHKKYFEVTLLPDGDIDLRALWERVIGQLHNALSDFVKANGKNTIGCSFPQYSLTQHSLGQKLRVFGVTEQDLASLRFSSSVKDIVNYVHISTIKDVPKAGAANFGKAKRVTLTRAAKLARRRVKRSETQGKKITFEEALALYSDGGFVKNLQYPYVMMKSNTTGNLFPLSVKASQAEHSNDGHFNLYGLSNTATVPYF